VALASSRRRLRGERFEGEEGPSDRSRRDASAHDAASAGRGAHPRCGSRRARRGGNRAWVYRRARRGASRTMLTLPTSVRLYLAAEPADLRCGHDGLRRHCSQRVEAESLRRRHLFVFLGRRLDRVKILVWDRNGFVLSRSSFRTGGSSPSDPDSPSRGSSHPLVRPDRSLALPPGSALRV